MLAARLDDDDFEIAAQFFWVKFWGPWAERAGEAKC